MSNVVIDTNNSYPKVMIGLQAKSLVERGIAIDRLQIIAMNAMIEKNVYGLNPQEAVDALHEVDALKHLGTSLANKIITDVKYDIWTLGMYGEFDQAVFPVREWISNDEGAPIATQVPWDPDNVDIPTFATRAEAIAHAHQMLADWQAANPGKVNTAAYAGAL